MPSDRLFGVISMTAMLWKYLYVQVFLVVSSYALCFVPLTNVLLFRRLKMAGTALLVLSFILTGMTYLLSTLKAWSIDSSAPPREVAAALATEILTMMHVRWMWVPFALAMGVTLTIQDSRRGRLKI